MAIYGYVWLLCPNMSMFLYRHGLQFQICSIKPSIYLVQAVHGSSHSDGFLGYIIYIYIYKHMLIYHISIYFYIFLSIYLPIYLYIYIYIHTYVYVFPRCLSMLSPPPCLKLRMLRLPVLPGRGHAVVQGLHARLQGHDVLEK